MGMDPFLKSDPTAPLWFGSGSNVIACLEHNGATMWLGPRSLLFILSEPLAFCGFRSGSNVTARLEHNGATLWLGPLYDGPLTLTVEVDKGVTAFLLSLMRSFNLFVED